MNEGEDPNTPITSGDNPPADNSDGMFSIHHGSEPTDESNEVDLGAVEPDDSSDNENPDDNEPADNEDPGDNEPADNSDDEPIAETPSPTPNFDNDAEPQDIFGYDNNNNDTSSDPAPTAPAAAPPVGVEHKSYAQRRSGGMRDFSSNNAQTPDFFNNAMAANEAAIVTNNERRSGNKKKFILIGAVGALVLILIVALVAVLSGMPRSVSAKDTLTKFNSFANYLINGSESTVTLTGQYNETEHYHIEDFYPGSESVSSEEITSFATKAKDFVDVARGAQVSNELKSELISYANNIYAWSLYASFTVDSKELANVYEKDGEGRANRYIDDKYSKLSKMDDMEPTKNALVDSMKLQLEYIKLIEVDGCKVSELSDDCLDKVHQIDNTNDIPGRLNQRLDEAGQLAGRKKSESIKKSWDISNKLLEEAK